MIIFENFKIDRNKYNLENDAYFMRVDPENLSNTLLEILIKLRDMSWLGIIDNDLLKKSYKLRAEKTCKKLEEKFKDESDTSKIKKEAGEYIVSCLSKEALVNGQNHKDIPLMELLGRKSTNNPGFDFYTQKANLVTAGESKYVNCVNAYNSSLSQIKDFLVKRKHVEDIPLLVYLVDSIALENMGNNILDVCAAFSCTKINSSKLIDNIVKNTSFIELNKKHTVYLIAVDMNND